MDKEIIEEIIELKHLIKLYEGEIKINQWNIQQLHNDIEDLLKNKIIALSNTTTLHENITSSTYIGESI